MIHAFDTYYFDNSARTVCLTFNDWTDKTETSIVSDILKIRADYKSGEFYKRELPCILSLISKLSLLEGDIIVIDGYVSLNSIGRKGLGYYSYEELNENFPVIGIAKNEFSENDDQRLKVFRGISKKPLFVTSIGVAALHAHAPQPLRSRLSRRNSV